MLAPIAYRTLNDLVTDQLREAILSGRFAPGMALNQRDIADQLSVSRMPVREAFRALEIEGLIRGLPRRKAVVVALQPEDVADIVDILAAIEGRVAERAAGTLEDSVLDRLRGLRDAIRATASDDVARLLDLDAELHTTICQPPTSRLRLLVQTHRNALRPYLMAAGGLAERRVRAESEHDDLIAALQFSDPQAAARVVGEHVRAEGQALIEHLRSRLTR